MLNLNTHTSSTRRWLLPLNLLAVLTACNAFAGANVEEIEQTFLRDPQVIFSRPPVESETYPHFGSNEHDWQNDRGGLESVDLIVGFGNNNAYDVALSRRAKGMVIVDHAIEPLIIQAYVLRPLLEAAPTRAEFLGLLRGRRLTDIPSDIDAAELFRLVEARTPLLPVRKMDRNILPEVRALEGDVAGTMVAAYFRTAQLIARVNGGDVKAKRPLHGRPSPFLLRHERGFWMGLIFDQYQAHYAAESPTAEDRIKKRSFLYDEKNYRFLRQMFLERRVFFAQADVREPGLYRSVAKLMEARGWSKVAINTSNIFDSQFEAGEIEENHRQYTQFVHDTCALLLESGAAAPIYFRQTRGVLSKHHFEHHKLMAPKDAYQMRFDPVWRKLNLLDVFRGIHIRVVTDNE